MAFDILDRKYFPEIVVALKAGPLSFNDLQRKLRISPNTIGRRVKELKKFGLIEPTLDQTGARTKVKYRLTQKGKEAAQSIEQFLALGEEAERKIKS